MTAIRRWGLSVVTMVSVVTSVLLVTGWGSAIASVAASGSPVIVKNPTTNPVNVRDINTPRTVLIAHGTVGPVPGGGSHVQAVPPTDVSAYREVTLYWSGDPSDEGAQLYCEAWAWPPPGGTGATVYVGRGVSLYGPLGAGSDTVDPAPPTVAATCFNQDANLTHAYTANWWLVGRTG
jgi:hypothetical protein